LQQAFDCLDLQIDLALIVGRAAGENVIAAHFGLKRRRLPFVQRVRRLYVVMAVKQDGGLTGSAQPFGVNQRVAGAFDQSGGRHAGRLQFIANKFGGAADIGLVLGERADAGNAQERFQAFQFFVHHPTLAHLRLGIE
jgi:hypothetical protein